MLLSLLEAARYSTLLSHTYAVVYVYAHNIPGRLVVNKQSNKPAAAGAAAGGESAAQERRGAEEGEKNGGGREGASALKDMEEGDGDGYVTRNLELRVYTPLSGCRTHRWSDSLVLGSSFGRLVTWSLGRSGQSVRRSVGLVWLVGLVGLFDIVRI